MPNEPLTRAEIDESLRICEAPTKEAFVHALAMLPHAMKTIVALCEMLDEKWRNDYPLAECFDHNPPDWITVATQKQRDAAEAREAELRNRHAEDACVWSDENLKLRQEVERLTSRVRTLTGRLDFFAWGSMGTEKRMVCRWAAEDAAEAAGRETMTPNDAIRWLNQHAEHGLYPSDVHQTRECAMTLAKEVERLREQCSMATTAFCNIDSGIPEPRKVAAAFLHWQETQMLAAKAAKAAKEKNDAASN